ncbi:hypothetical protein [Paraburkholderia sp. JHI869]|uniref:hypothetical protein n=1 Tax=Paraburkholderia sp. JHI869 TaxID=3112959 RepID=UPI00317746A5
MSLEKVKNRSPIATGSHISIAITTPLHSTHFSLDMIDPFRKVTRFSCDALQCRQASIAHTFTARALSPSTFHATWAANGRAQRGRHNDALAGNCVAHFRRLSNNDVGFFTNRACLDRRTEPATVIERICRCRQMSATGQTPSGHKREGEVLSPHLVQIDGVCAISLIDMDTLSIEKDSIPDRESSDVLKRESG